MNAWPILSIFAVFILATLVLAIYAVGLAAAPRRRRRSSAQPTLPPPSPDNGWDSASRAWEADQQATRELLVEIGGSIFTREEVERMQRVKSRIGGVR